MEKSQRLYRNKFSIILKELIRIGLLINICNCASYNRSFSSDGIALTYNSHLLGWDYKNPDTTGVPII